MKIREGLEMEKIAEDSNLISETMKNFWNLFYYTTRKQITLMMPFILRYYNVLFQ